MINFDTLKETVYLLIFRENSNISITTPLEDILDNTIVLIQTTYQSVYNNHEIVNGQFKMDFQNITPLWFNKKKCSAAFLFLNPKENENHCIHFISDNKLDKEHIETKSYPILADTIYFYNDPFNTQFKKISVNDYFYNFGFPQERSTTVQSTTEPKYMPQIWSYYINEKNINNL